MQFGAAIRNCLQNYATFSGRACRSEYWWFVLFDVLCSAAGGILDQAVNSGFFSAVISLVLLLPGLAVSVRRLHDLDRSGWWLLLGLIPLIGTLILLFWFIRRGLPGPNRHGADPLAPAQVAA